MGDRNGNFSLSGKHEGGGTDMVTKEENLHIYHHIAPYPSKEDIVCL